MGSAICGANCLASYSSNFKKVFNSTNSVLTTVYVYPTEPLIALVYTVKYIYVIHYPLFIHVKYTMFLVFPLSTIYHYFH